MLLDYTSCGGTPALRRRTGAPHDSDTPSPLPSPGGRGRKVLGTLTHCGSQAPSPPLPPGEGRGEGTSNFDSAHEADRAKKKGPAHAGPRLPIPMSDPSLQVRRERVRVALEGLD